jgi:hypothetical protein
LVFNNEVQNEYKKINSTTYITAYYDLRENVKKLASNTLWHKIDSKVLQIVAQYFNIVLSNNNADSLIKELQRNIDQLTRVRKDLLKTNKKIYTHLLSKFQAKAYNSYDSSVDKILILGQKILNSSKKYRRILFSLKNKNKNKNKLLSFEKKITLKLLRFKKIKHCPEILISKCKWWGCRPVFKKDPVCLYANKVIKKGNKIIYSFIKKLKKI